ncbi:hypothetical protein C8R43DRAFT_942368 [Mycena crocata]|nr:hypothetical protein C8R43DRAFT_942368 [Mycena crocata]
MRNLENAATALFDILLDRSTSTTSENATGRTSIAPEVTLEQCLPTSAGEQSPGVWIHATPENPNWTTLAASQRYRDSTRSAPPPTVHPVCFTSPPVLIPEHSGLQATLDAQNMEFQSFNQRTITRDIVTSPNENHPLTPPPVVRGDRSPTMSFHTPSESPSGDSIVSSQQHGDAAQAFPLFTMSFDPALDSASDCMNVVQYADMEHVEATGLQTVGTQTDNRGIVPLNPTPPDYGFHRMDMAADTRTRIHPTNSTATLETLIARSPTPSDREFGSYGTDAILHGADFENNASIVKVSSVEDAKNCHVPQPNHTAQSSPSDLHVTDSNANGPQLSSSLLILSRPTVEIRTHSPSSVLPESLDSNLSAIPYKRFPGRLPAGKMATTGYRYHAPQDSRTVWVSECNVVTVKHQDTTKPLAQSSGRPIREYDAARGATHRDTMH